MKIKRKIIKIIFIICICFVLSGCTKNEKKELENKVIAELRYVNIKILDMLNILNNITFANNTIISQQVKLDAKNEKQHSKQGQEDGGTANADKGTQGGESSNEQNGNQNKEEQDLINTNKMSRDTILSEDKNNVDWQIIKSEIELLNESWSIIVLDLQSLKVNSNTILEFSTNLNNVILAIKNEDKSASLTELATLYESIPKFLEEIDVDKNIQIIRQTQSYVVNAYSLAEDMSNPNIDINIQKAVDNYAKIVSNRDYTKDKTYKTNKIYVLLNELENSLNTKDSDVFYIKYKNFMEAINEL